jgi:hypothetical protein
MKPALIARWVMSPGIIRPGVIRAKLRLLFLCGAVFALAVCALAVCGSLPFVQGIFADSKPAVQLTVANAQPRQLEDITEKAILRDYTAAWQAIATAFENNSLQPLNENFSGFALEKLVQRVKDQKQNGLSTRIIDHGHKVDAIFYSPDGAAIELSDTASIETQVLDGGKLIHSSQAQIHYYAVMTGAEDRWKVRVLESAEK